MPHPTSSRPPSRRASLIVAAALACLAATPAFADERSELEQLRATTLALIQALVDQGLISSERAAALARQATAPRPVASAAAPAASANEWGRPPTGVVRVPYIPETLKAQIKEDIKLDVLATARDEGWADARKLPAWLKSFSFEGDLRVRDEADLFGADNTPAALYRSQTTSPAWSPDFTNTQTSRNRLTLRARFGFTAGVSDDLSAGVRLATGNSPTSASQTLGAAPGFFNRYSMALDRAWLRWEPRQDIRLQAGRMAVPFFGSDLLWPDDLSLDGVSAHAERTLGSGFYVFATAGAFALQELELTASDKWLYGFQLGADWAISDRTSLRVGAAVYDFRHVEGVRETNPAPSGAAAGTVPYYTSEYRLGARSHGNTLIRLNDPTNAGDPVWGLASKFRPFNLTAALTLQQFDPVQVGLNVDYVKNSAFDLADIQRRDAPSAIQELANRTSGLQMRLQVGSRHFGERGTWNSFFALRQFQRDAWVDALTDTTWNLGGTNYKGYSIGGAYSFDRQSSVGLRWTSTRSLDDGSGTAAGSNLSNAPLKIDVIQVEVNSRF